MGMLSYDIIDTTGADLQTLIVASIHTLKKGNKNVVLLDFSICVGLFR